MIHGACAQRNPGDRRSRWRSGGALSHGTPGTRAAAAQPRNTGRSSSSPSSSIAVRGAGNVSGHGSSAAIHTGCMPACSAPRMSFSGLSPTNRHWLGSTPSSCAARWKIRGSGFSRPIFCRDEHRPQQSAYAERVDLLLLLDQRAVRDHAEAQSARRERLQGRCRTAPLDRGRREVIEPVRVELGDGGRLGERGWAARSSVRLGL